MAFMKTDYMASDCSTRVTTTVFPSTDIYDSFVFEEGRFETVENGIWTIVDVRDVAEALLLVYEKKEASGRYICAPHPVQIHSLVEKLKSKYPNYNYPKK